VDSTEHVFTIIRDTSTQVEMYRWVVLLMILSGKPAGVELSKSKGRK
jgi:hypothetical protein